MFIEKIFAPKWKNKNPQVRKQALLSLDPLSVDSQKIFLDVIHNDSELALKRLAIRRLDDVDTLLSLRTDDVSEEMYEEVTGRICQLLAGEGKTEIGDEKTIQVLDRLDEYRVLEYVAKHSASARIKKHLVEKITDDALLAEIVLSDTADDVRDSALSKISSSNILKRLIKDARRKNRDIATLAQSQLESVLNHEQKIAVLLKESREMSAAMLDLVHLCDISQAWSKYEVKVHDLYRHWQKAIDALSKDGASVDASMQEKTRIAYAEFIQKLQLQKERDAAESRKKLQEQEKIHVENVEDKDDVLSQQQEINRIAELRKKIDHENITQEELLTTRQEVYQPASIGESHDKSGANRTKVELETELDSMREELLADIDNAGKFLESLAKLEQDISSWLKPNKIISNGLLKKFKSTFSSLATPALTNIGRKSYQKSQQDLRELENRIIQAKAQQDKVEQEFSELVSQLEAAIKEGKSKHAQHLVNRGRNLLKELQGSSGKSVSTRKGLLSRFNRCANELFELKDWQKWSTDPVKEKLIHRAQQLLDSISATNEPHYEDIAQQVKELRAEWRDLAKVDLQSKKADAQWEVFDGICNEIYAPCQQFFDELSAARDKNLENRNKICEDLEHYQNSIAGRDSDNIDWKAMNKIIRTARTEWKQLGIVNRGDKAMVNKRFNKVIHALEKKLKEEKTRNREQKELLIKRATGIFNSVEKGGISIDDAVEDIRRIQDEWKSIWMSDRDKELWEQFQPVCNKVFACRAEQRQAEKSALDEEFQTRENLCEQLEALTSLPGEQLQKARSSLDGCLYAWSELPRLKKTHKLEKRLSKAVANFDRALKRYEQDKLKEVCIELQGNIKLCLQLEEKLANYCKGQLAENKLIESVAEIEQKWYESGMKNQVLEQAVNARMAGLKQIIEQLPQVSSGDLLHEIQQKSEGLIREKEFVCMKMEILANVESPPDKREERMAYQIQRLADKMKQSNEDNSQLEAEGLLMEWHTSGYVFPDQSMPLEERFFKALHEFDKVYQYLN